MSVILLFSGRYVDLTQPEPADVDIIDIAWALGHTNRFTGHAGSYTVADHSVLVSHLVPIEHAPRALLHDAAETYLGDLSWPLKQVLRASGQFSAFEHLEADWDLAISAALLGGAPRRGLAEDLAIKAADRQALWIEKSAILGCADLWDPRSCEEPPPGPRRDAALRAFDAVLDPAPGWSPWSRFLHRAVDLGLASPADDARTVQRAIDIRDAARSLRAAWSPMAEEAASA